MTMLSSTDIYWKFTGQCTECGSCTKACQSLTAAGMTLGDIARTMLDVDASFEDPSEAMLEIFGNESLVQAVRGCFLCTSCQQTCFASNDVSELVYAARKDFQQLGLIPREAWSSVQVDQEWDIFTAYRAIHGIAYTDLIRHIESEGVAAQADCEVAFFPGCSLAAYGPELTREVFAKIEELGGKTTMIDHCCGSPLRSAGFYDRAIALCERIAAEVAASGAKQLVCVCPGCCNAMQATLAASGMDDVEVMSLPHFLVEHGSVAQGKVDGDSLCLSKSCQDRDGIYLDDTRAALGIPSDTPAVFAGCCGAGGAVSAFNPGEQAGQVMRKLSLAASGKTLVTMCPTCTYTYAFQLMNTPMDLGNKNYLELIFENQFDWEKVSAQLNGMWTGEYGAWLSQVFS